MSKTAGDRELTVRGKVINETDGRGVHGIAVRLAAPKFLLAKSDPETLSHADGTFELPFRLRLGAARCVLRFFPLRFFDREGQLLHAQKVPADFSLPHAVLRVMLPSAKLGSHFSRQPSITRQSGRLVPEAHLTLLTHALSRLPNFDSARYENFLFERRCPFPPLDRFENLLDDVWGTIDGDPAAHARLKDVLEVFSADGMRGTSVPLSARFIVQKDSSVQGGLDHLISEIQATADVWAPVEGLLGRDTVIPLLLATAIVSGEERVVPAMRTMLGQLGAYRPLAALFAAAEQSLSGDTTSERYLLGMFQTLDRMCDFERSPLPFEIPLIPPGPRELKNLLCTAEAIQAVASYKAAQILSYSGTYRIDTMEPARVCSGDQITLRGVRFTNGPHKVRFPGMPGTRNISIDVDAISWKDTEIVVIVPKEAACGPIDLLIPGQCVTVRVCNTYQDVCTYRSAERQFLFNGCRPRITFFGLNGPNNGPKADANCVTFGSNRAISWIVAPESARTSLTVRKGSGMEEPIHTTGGSRDSVPIDTLSLTTYTYRLTATNPTSTCGNVTESLTITVAPPDPTLRIVGVEFTQGIQTFSVPGPPLFSPNPLNNSVPLIAEMDTIVRVFISSFRGPGFMPDTRVSGRMDFNGAWYRPINDSSIGGNPFIIAKETPSRSQVNDSLNFLIPAARARGRGPLTIEVFAAQPPCETGVTAETKVPIEWTNRKPFPVTVRRIAQPRSGDVLSESQAMALINEAFDRLPSPRSGIRLFPGVFTIHPGTAEANYCNDPGAYYQLARSVAYEHNGVEGWAAWDPHETAWIGLYVRDCSPDGMMSWPHTTTCISEPDAEVAAHELAHTAGMGHTKTSAGEECGTQPVPCYTLPDDGTLSDVVFDIRRNRVRSRAVDLMSYRAGFRFLHPVHWMLVRNFMDTRFP